MYRTDLAVENIEIKREEGIIPGEKDGVKVTKETHEEDILVTTVEVINPKGEVLLGKPMGRYVTVETKPIVDSDESKENALAKTLAAELSKFIRFHYYLKVLVVGLGNDSVTPDSLGPKVLEQVKITRHLFHIYDCDGDEEMAMVSGISPGVMATTGIETADQIQKAVELTKPELVLVVDALAAKNIERISSTIQISDTGISPGAGMGNYRKFLNQESLGVKVIALGVPTVIDSKNLITDAMKEASTPENIIDDYLKNRDFDMVVTSTDIDVVIEKFSKILAKGINITLHPGIYS